MFEALLATLVIAQTPESQPTVPVATEAARIDVFGPAHPAYVNELFLSGGVTLSGNQVTLLGGRYRRVVSELLSVQGGLETGSSTVTFGSASVTGSMTKIHAGVTTNGILYGGAGFSLLQLTATTNVTAPMTSSMGVVEVIGGVRTPGGPFAAGAELRVGLNGTSTVAVQGGIRF